MIDPNDLPRYVGERYILNFIRGITPYQEDVSTPAEERCRADNVPILSEETKSLLGFLLELKHPRRILEIGTAYGFSALYMMYRHDRTQSGDDSPGPRTAGSIRIVGS